MSDRCKSRGDFDNSGGELKIPAYGLTLTIPPGSLEEGRSVGITVEVLRDIPRGLNLKDDEMLVTQGFHCLPPGLKFVGRNPARLKIPHCANFIDPQKVQIVLYSWNQEGITRTLMSSKTCRVTSHHVELFLEHFSQYYVASETLASSFTSKRMSFMPFLPRKMPPSRRMLLEFRMVNKPHGISWRVVHDIGENATYQPAKDDDDEMNVKDKDLTVTCQLNDNAVIDEVVARDFVKKTKHTIYFDLDFNGKADDLLVQMKLIQSKLGMPVKFRTYFLDISEAGIPARTSDISPPQQRRTKREVTDDQLEMLSKHLPSEEYTLFCAKIGIKYDEAKNILAQSNKSYRAAVRECLAQWKIRTGGSLDELTEILVKCSLKDMMQYLK